MVFTPTQPAGSWQSWWDVADRDRVWVEIAFEGGQALRVTVPLQTAEDLDRGLASDGDSLSFVEATQHVAHRCRLGVIVDHYQRRTAHARVR